MQVSNTGSTAAAHPTPPVPKAPKETPAEEARETPQMEAREHQGASEPGMGEQVDVKA